MIRTVADLKNWFKTGLKPTESNFSDWLDSFWHKSDTVDLAEKAKKDQFGNDINIADIMAAIISAPTDSPIVEPLSLTFITGSNSYTVIADTPDNVTVTANVAGEIILTPLVLGKAIIFQIKGVANVTIDGVEYVPGNTVFAVYDEGLSEWNITSTNVADVVIIDYSDISVDGIETTATYSQISDTRFRLAFCVGNYAAKDLVFFNKPTNQANIGIYSVLTNTVQSGGTYSLICEKVASYKDLKIVRVKGGKVYENLYDGENLASASFIVLNDLVASIGDKISKTTIKSQMILVDDWSAIDTETGLTYVQIDESVVDTDWIDAYFDNGDIDVVTAASILPGIEIVENGFLIYAKAIPTTKVTLNYKIIGGN